MFTPTKETIREDDGRHNLSNAIPQQPPKLGDGTAGKHNPSHEASDEPTRQAEKTRRARSARAPLQERMVDIGRGNQQAGRQGQ